MVPVPSGDDLVAVLAAAEADVDVHVHLLGGAALVDHVHGLQSPRIVRDSWFE